MSSDATRTQLTEAKIAPWLSVADATKAVEYYKAAFGAVELERLEDEAGSVVVAQLSIGGADFWVQQDEETDPHALGDRSPATALFTTLTQPTIYQELVGEEGWLPEKYEVWLAETLQQQLLSAR